MKTNSLATPSLISEKELKQIQTIIKKIESDSHSHIFQTPVLYKEWGLDDYIKIIRKPMDISTVKSKLIQGVYQSPSDVFNDIQLIWDNCKRYNQEESDIYKTAVLMEKLSDEIIQKSFSLPVKSKKNIFY
jgi:transcription initiation factor TFIID subunit 2